MRPKPELPSDPRALRQLVIELLEALQEKDRQIGQLSSQLQALKRRLFGPRSEKFDEHQLVLDLGAWLAANPPSEQAQPVEPEKAVSQEEASSRNGHGRRKLSRELPRQRTEYHPCEADLSCRECEQKLCPFGEEVSEQLEYVPASLFVREHARIKYACPSCQGNVVIGSIPVKPIAKGVAGPGLLAHVVTSKYADHLPLNRLEGIFERQGVELSRSTLCDWIAASATLVEPVVEAMKAEILASRKIHTDDTTVPVLEKDRGKTKTGRLWVYVGDLQHEHIVFDYTPDRCREGPRRWLAGYEGYLQADAYAGYDAIYGTESIREVACWAHARRKFFDAIGHDSLRARFALAHIRELYDVEKRARELDPDARRQLRQQKARPILKTLHEWLQDQVAGTLPKSPIREAIGYALGQWAALIRYLDDGILEIDNNRAERALRRVAIGRKNWMFAGSDAGGHRAATLYSLIASCAILKLDPYAYLRDVLERLASQTVIDPATLTPKAWQQARQTAIAA
jgi:transposase